MAPTVPNGEPTQLVVGSSWQWDKHYSDAPPSEGYALSYAFTGPGAVATFAAATSADGDYYEIRRTKAQTAGLTAGTYELVGYVETGTDRFVIYRGTVELLPDLSADTDAAAHDEKVLAAINARLEGRTTEDTQRIQVAGRSVDQIPIMELVRLQGIYRARVFQKRNAGQARRHEVTFGVPA